MTTTTPPAATALPADRGEQSAAAVAKRKLSSPWASLAAILIAVLWTLPTFGLLVSSFRPERAIKTTGWWTFFSNPTLTMDNYRDVLDSESGAGLGSYFVNSLVITIPSVIIPLTLATIAAYAFAWIKFPGRNILFLVIFALQIVPLQVTLIPLLTLYVDAGLANTFWTIWLSHSIFGLPLAIYLLHNFMREVPATLLEAARVDGAGHVAIFFRVLLPLLRPALAAFGIFQFLWVWNDLLVALTFAGGGDKVAPITVALANLSGTRGTAWHLLSAGAFVSIIVPVTIFLLLQRYFVRGLLAGSVKG
ncbi:sugar ABC transporter permease [Actinoplanes sp. NBRC 14428]|uniref:Carbohydrate ABC transporter membrane protein 2 (CUT1 family) n=1 Tax=Pseudosporangium ferrugineum TaxID=439699 RepID=A0A2T0SHM6_9ACTN|nr:carbohydrate ABC transporter permease [Pseudosporangium ferrugineum]PRY32925.1 carbohydrate ABC transporter membrane protein 2 (CUT1 family) [Pseudosporangium ferrugineum]BCJ49114.1 sugar ABC transporter permease [Actinoplanes sp. NBRC 14428]